jgi:hypothetical protein
MADPAAVGNAFAQHYYTTYDSNRAALGALYRPQSMMTFNQEPFIGPAIMEKLGSLAFQKVAHNVKSCDCQPSGCGGILVHVIGELVVSC